MSLQDRYRVSGTVFISDDPVAQSTDWTPLKRGGASFQTHKLVEVSPELLEFRPTVFMRIFSGVFLIPGAVAVIAAVWLAVTGSGDWKTALFLCVWGLLFGGGGALLWYFGGRRMVFDFAERVFRSGRKNSYRDAATDTGKTIPFNRFHALQIVAEYCSDSKGPGYTSYELNLVLDDGSRRNITDHGKLGKLRRDAEILRARLKLPLWDNSHAECSRMM